LTPYGIVVRTVAAVGVDDGGAVAGAVAGAAAAGVRVGRTLAGVDTDDGGGTEAFAGVGGGGVPQATMASIAPSAKASVRRVTLAYHLSPRRRVP
jgi:hypothetical protein